MANETKKQKDASDKIRFRGPAELSSINIAGREYEVRDGVIELEPGFTDHEAANLQAFGFILDQ
jgi:hypothetical protein